MIDVQSFSPGLSRGDDGIWYPRAETSEPVSYPAVGNENSFSVEDSSFWFRHRNRCIVSAVTTYPPVGQGLIFDIGGGNGFVSAGLAEAGFPSAVVEPGGVGASNARRRGLEVICATTDAAGFREGSLPAVGLFDVVEHVEDDLVFLQSLRRLLDTNGRLYLTVPAYPFLWSAEDVSAGHFRRYSLGDIERVLRKAEFEVEFASYIFRYLPLPIYLLRTLPHKLGWARTRKNMSRDHAAKSGVAGRVLGWALRPEVARLNAGKPMKFGGSCLVVARKAS